MNPMNTIYAGQADPTKPQKLAQLLQNQTSVPQANGQKKQFFSLAPTTQPNPYGGMNGR
jgi:hypothetical protein